MESPQKKMDKLTRRPNRKFWIAALALLAILLGVVCWTVFWRGFDFYRPTRTVACNEPPAGIKPERFIAFGDFGEGTLFQGALGAQMAKTYDQTPFKVALLLGDNIYPDGDIKKLGRTHFEDPYRGLIERKVKFVAAIGDHDDHKGHQYDEMAYFKMPSAYYQYSDGPVDFFILNTTFFVRSPEQQAWLDQALARSKAPWKIVAAHHPVYSSGRHGHQTSGLRRVLEPILVKHYADLYLAGHDHDYERFEPIRGVNYIVSGGGGSYLYDFKTVEAHSLVRIKTIHFLLFSATANDLWMKAINRYGETVDCAHWHKDATGPNQARR
jgi:hypothetical protein